MHCFRVRTSGLWQALEAARLDVEGRELARQMVESRRHCQRERLDALRLPSQVHSVFKCDTCMTQLTYAV